MIYEDIKHKIGTLKDRFLGKEFVHFIHVSKTGGTAVKSALRPCSSTQEHRIFLHKHPTSVADIPRGEKIFIAFRDPAKRFESAFYSRFRKGQPKFYVEWTEAEEEAFQRFKSPTALAEALSSSNPETKHAAKEAMGSIRHIRDSYSKWYIDKKYFLSRHHDILAVGRQERLDDFFQWVTEYLDLPEASLPSEPEKAHKRPEHFDRGLSDQALSNLHQWYSEDYSFLNFCRNNKKLLNYFLPK